MTVDKAIADKLVAHHGVHPGDEHLPPIVLIVEYDNAWGGVGYGCVRQGQRNVYTPSSSVGNPRVYWSLDGEPVEARS